MYSKNWRRMNGLEQMFKQIASNPSTRAPQPSALAANTNNSTSLKAVQSIRKNSTTPQNTTSSGLATPKVSIPATLLDAINQQRTVFKPYDS